MPIGKTIEFDANEYPELDGLEGEEVPFFGIAQINRRGSLTIVHMAFKTENDADRAMRMLMMKTPDDNPDNREPSDF